MRPDLREGEGHGRAIERLVIGVRKGDLDLMRPRREANDDQDLSAGVRPVPGRLIDHDMDMTDTGRHFERLGTNTGKILRFTARY